MTRNDDGREEKHVGPAYPARYARLGRVGSTTLLWRGALVVGVVVLLAVVILAVLPR